MKYTGLLLIGSLLIGGCLKPDPLGEGQPEPVLEFLVVEPEYGTTGRTFIVWRHRDGPNAVQGQPGIVRFTIRTAGVSREEDVTTPFDTRVVDDLLETEYRLGKDVQEIRIQQQDVAGRVVRYDCFGPIWECFKK
jgi:hypothetical protein